VPDEAVDGMWGTAPEEFNWTDAEDAEIEPGSEEWQRAWAEQGMSRAAEHFTSTSYAELLDHLAWHPAPEAPPRHSDGSLLSGDELCEWVRERSPHILLGFSMGKDSLATFHQVRRYWPLENIHGYYLHVHPHLGWINRQLDYYRRELGISIRNVTHRFVHRQLGFALHQPPHHRPVIAAARWSEVEYHNIYWAIANDADVLDERPWVAQGVRAADSPIRRIVISQRGPHNIGQRVFYPIHDDRKADVVRRLHDLGVKLPVDYRLWGRTFDGLDYRFVKPLAEHFPEDYERLLELWPLVETAFIRRGEEPPRAGQR
jgi:hypothetical protein